MRRLLVIALLLVASVAVAADSAWNCEKTPSGTMCMCGGYFVDGELLIGVGRSESNANDNLIAFFVRSSNILHDENADMLPLLALSDKFWGEQISSLFEGYAMRKYKEWGEVQTFMLSDPKHQVRDWLARRDRPNVTVAIVGSNKVLSFQLAPMQWDCMVAGPRQ